MRMPVPGRRVNVSARLIPTAKANESNKLPSLKTGWRWPLPFDQRERGKGNPGGRQAAQSALLPGTPRSRLCGKDGRSAVRLSQGQTFEEGGGRIAQEAKRCSGCHLLRREAGYSGHRNDGTRFAAGAGRARNLRARA